MLRKSLLLVALLLPLSAVAEDEVSIAVMEFASKGGISEKQMDALGDLLANEIRDLGGYRVIGKSDIRAAIDFESQKTLLGCTDAACIAELGGALGVRYVVVGNVSLFGDLYLVNLKILDVEHIRVAKGISKKVSGGQSKLIDALSGAARELMEGAGLKTGSKPAPKPDPVPEKTVKAPEPPPPPPPTPRTEVKVEAESPSRPMNTWGHVTFWSGVGATVWGAVSMMIALDAASTYKKGEEHWESRLDARDDCEMYTGIMWISFTMGAALMTTGIILWVMEPDEPGTTATLSPTPDGQGMVFGVVGRW
jgi:TolB-like protein